MNQILDITLTLDNNILTAVDSTVKNMPDNAEEDYIQNYCTVEFITHNGEENIVGNPIIQRINTNPTMSSVSQFELNDNGIYYYYKMSIPLIDHFIGTEHTINLLGEVYFDNEGRLKQIVEKPVSSEKQSILESSEVIDYIDAYYAITKNLGSSLEANESYFFPKKSIFSICKIRKCLVYLQRKMLFSSNEENRCQTSSELRNRRDFLLSAVYVINYLTETGNFEEAQRIVDNLSSSCDFTCGDDLEIFNDCGCGHTI